MERVVDKVGEECARGGQGRSGFCAQTRRGCNRRVVRDVVAATSARAGRSSTLSDTSIVLAAKYPVGFRGRPKVDTAADLDEHVRRQVGFVGEEHAAPALHTLLGLVAPVGAADLPSCELPDVVERPCKVVGILDRDPEVVAVGAIPLGEPPGMGVVPGLSEDSDRCLEIERGHVLCVLVSGSSSVTMRSRRVDEARDGLVVLELRVAVEEQRRDVAIGETLRVQFLQVRREMGESLGVEELDVCGGLAAQAWRPRRE